MDFRNMTVDTYTTPSPYFVDIYDSIQDIHRQMEEKGIRHLPVMSGKEIVGIISHRDLLLVRSVAKFDMVFAGDIMVKNPYIVDLRETLENVVFHMSSKKIGSAIICDPKGELHGIFTLTDALNALIEIIRDEVEVS